MRKIETDRCNRWKSQTKHTGISVVQSSKLKEINLTPYKSLRGQKSCSVLDNSKKNKITISLKERQCIKTIQELQKNNIIPIKRLNNKSNLMIDCQSIIKTPGRASDKKGNVFVMSDSPISKLTQFAEFKKILKLKVYSKCNYSSKMNHKIKND